jgi:hypothetical protein
MDRYIVDNKTKEDDTASQSDSDYSDNYYSANESNGEEKCDELHCKNIDPVLARLMGIIIEEHKKIDWKPPSENGLNNSKEIISPEYFTRPAAAACFDIDYFDIIKSDILNYRQLSESQLEYIKKLNNEEKFELIEIYNQLVRQDYFNRK